MLIPRIFASFSAVTGQLLEDSFNDLFFDLFQFFAQNNFNVFSLLDAFKFLAENIRVKGLFL